MRTKPGRRTWSVVSIGAIAIVWLAVTATANASGSGKDDEDHTILSLLQKLQTAVVGLQSTTANLQTTVNAIDRAVSQISTMGGNTQFTPLLAVTTNNGVACGAVNVSTVSHIVTIALISSGTTPSGSDTTTLTAGQGSVLQVGVMPMPGVYYYCKFTVLDGARADIRGTGFVFGPSNTALYQVAAE